MSPCILNYLGEGGNRHRPRTEPGTRFSGNFSYFMDPPPLRLGSWSVWRRNLLGRVCAPWYIALLRGGGKAGPAENGNWSSIVCEFQLFPGSRLTLGLRRGPFGVGIYSRGVCLVGHCEFLADGCTSGGPGEILGCRTLLAKSARYIGEFARYAPRHCPIGVGIY